MRQSRPDCRPCGADDPLRFYQRKPLQSHVYGPALTTRQRQGSAPHELLFVKRSLPDTRTVCGGGSWVNLAADERGRVTRPASTRSAHPDRTCVRFNVFVSTA